MPDMSVASGGERKYSHVRRWRRYEVNVPIRVIIERAMLATIIDGRGSALSQGGMAIFAGAELKPGEHVGVEFTPPYSAPPIRVTARVCGRSGYHYGVEFLNADSVQRKNVAEFRSHLASIVGVIDSPS